MGEAFCGCNVDVLDARQEDALGVPRLLHVELTGFGGGFRGVLLTFVMGAKQDDVLGVTRLLRVALTGFGRGSGV